MVEKDLTQIFLDTREKDIFQPREKTIVRFTDFQPPVAPSTPSLRKEDNVIKNK